MCFRRVCVRFCEEVLTAGGHVIAGRAEWSGGVGSSGVAGLFGGDGRPTAAHPRSTRPQPMAAPTAAHVTRPFSRPRHRRRRGLPRHPTVLYLSRPPWQGPIPGSKKLNERARRIYTSPMIAALPPLPFDNQISNTRRGKLAAFMEIHHLAVTKLTFSLFKGELLPRVSLFLISLIRDPSACVEFVCLRQKKIETGSSKVSQTNKKRSYPCTRITCDAKIERRVGLL